MTAIPARLAPWLAGWRRALALGAAVFVLLAVAGLAVMKDRHALRRIAEACVADARWTGSPFPCMRVDPPDAGGGGYVIFRPPLLHDTVLVPTQKIIGVEDPSLDSSDVPNYFADAWRARAIVSGPDGEAPPRDRQLLIVNSSLRRTQDQLHIHMGCLRPEARRSLTAVARRLPVGVWRLVPAVVPHQPFWVLRLGRADLEGVDPFRLAHRSFAGVVDDLSQLTVAVAGATVAGEDDLLILASYAHAPGSWWPVGADDLLDSRCRPEPPSGLERETADSAGRGTGG